MYPYLETPWGTLELYGLMQIAGAVTAVIMQMVLLYWKAGRKRYVLFSALFGLYSLMGIYAGSLVRQTSYGKLQEGSLLASVMAGEGRHYLGLVLVSVILCLPFTWILSRLLRIRREEWEQCQHTVLNSLAAGLLVQHIFVRLGCFFRGCCYGKYYRGPGAIRMPGMEVPYPVFPSQLLEAAVSAVLLVLILILIAKNYDVFGIMVTGYAANIILSECFMDQKGSGMIWGLTIIQWWAVGLLVLGAGYLIWQIQWKKPWKKRQKR